jgi:hypothetical protein
VLNDALIDDNVLDADADADASSTIFLVFLLYYNGMDNIIKVLNENKMNIIKVLNENRIWIESAEI